MEGSCRLPSFHEKVSQCAAETKNLLASRIWHFTKYLEAAFFFEVREQCAVLLRQCCGKVSAAIVDGIVFFHRSWLGWLHYCSSVGSFFRCHMMRALEKNIEL